MKNRSWQRTARNVGLGMGFGAGFGLIVSYLSTNFGLGMAFGAFTAMNVVIALRRKGQQVADQPSSSKAAVNAIFPER